jgi:hypothetical protein
MNAAAQPQPTESPVAAAVNAVANAASGAVNAVANVANGAANAVNGAVNGAANAVNGAVNGAANAVANAATGAANAATNMLSNVAPPANNKKNNAGVSFNSLIPLGNNKPANNKPANNRPANNRPANQPANNRPANNKPANNQSGFFGNSKPADVGVNNAPPTFGNVSVPAMNSPWGLTLGIFVGLVVVFMVAFSYFSREIAQGYQYALASVQQAMGASSQPPVLSQIVPVQGSVKEVTMAPTPPQAVTPSQQAASHTSMAEKILPSGGGNEVYNVAQNKFTYYDAEPLCKALGAELATYEQVKTAWERGADWCNYGWVKGQMAVYPTQKDTYEKLQAGPEDQRMACGTTGINGGHFDNPDMLYGVNCYGKKPSQTAHDEEKLMDEGKIPKSPATLKVDQMVNEFKTQADSLFVKPFNDNKWSTK